jgi:putative hydroxymethylpyrimidine transport system substrate-binding protein
MVRRVCLALLAAALTASAAGCASTTSSDSRPDQDARLMLDSAPDAIHSGIYLATERGYDDAEGVHLDVEQPDAGEDGVKALASRQVDLALLDIHDLAAADAQGKDLVGVMALVQTPLGAVLTADGTTFRRPRDLEGHRVGVTGGAAGEAVLDSVVRGDGGDPAKVDTVALKAGGAVPALLAGRVAGATGRWSTDGVALTERKPHAKAFLVDDYGAPSYPEVVLAVTRETLETNEPVVRATIRALRRGYESAINDPDTAISALTDEEPTLDRTLQDDELQAVSPSFMAGADFFGQLQPDVLAKWATWEQKLGVVARKPDVAKMFDPSVAKTGLKQDPDS